MKLRINEKEVSNKTRYNRRKCRLLSDEEYDYWFDVGLEAFNRGDKCVPARNKELMDYLRKNPAKIGSTENKKRTQMDIAWTDGWMFGNLSDDSWKFENLREKQDSNTEVKYRVDVYNPKDSQSLLKREYVTAKSTDDARQEVFDKLTDSFKSKWDIKDTHSFEVMEVKGTNESVITKESLANKIPYDLVSTLVILRDWVDVGDAYLNDEHKMLVDIADSLFNGGIDVEDMFPKYQSLYNKYGSEYFDTVIEDIQALDSQVNGNNINDLIAEYNDKASTF